MTLTGYSDYYHGTLEKHRIALKLVPDGTGRVRPMAIEKWFRHKDINKTNSSLPNSKQLSKS
jgi:hypothetical protein